MKRLILLSMLISLIVVLALPTVQAAITYEDAVIVNDTVYVDIAGKGVLEQTPHTLTEGVNYPNVSFTSYFSETKNIDIGFAFDQDDDNIKPIGAQYLKWGLVPSTPIYGPVFKSQVIYNVEGFTLPDPNPPLYVDVGRLNATWHYNVTINDTVNETFYDIIAGFDQYEQLNETTYKIKWIVEEEIIGYEDDWGQYWADIPNDVWNVAYWNQKKVYLLNFTVDPLETATIRPIIQVYPNELGTVSAKYDIIMKFHEDTLEEAIEENRFVYLDPWINVSFGRKAPLQVVNSGCTTAHSYYPVYFNITYDSDMNSTFQDLYVGNDTANQWVPYDIIDYVESQWVEIRVNVSGIPASDNLNDTYFAYYDYDGSITTGQNGTTPYLLGDDFDDLETTGWQTDGNATNGFLGLIDGDYAQIESNHTNCIWEYTFRCGYGVGSHAYFHPIYKDADEYYRWIALKTGELKFYYYDTELNATSWAGDEELHNVRIRSNGSGGWTIWLDGVWMTDVVHATLTTSNYIYTISNAGEEFHLDNLRVLHYADPEPIGIVGEEEALVQFNPPSPVNITNVTGPWFANFSWSAGVGNVTDGYNITIQNGSGTHYINTSNSFVNVTNTTVGEWILINVSSYNASENGVINTTTLNGSTYIHGFLVNPTPSQGASEVAMDPTVFAVLVYCSPTPANVSFINNDTEISWGNHTSVANGTNATISVDLDGITVYNWYAEAILGDGTTLISDVFTFSTSGIIHFYEENDPTTTITANISVTGTNGTGVWNDTAISGAFNISSRVNNGTITLGEEVGLSFSTDGFHERHIVLPDGFGDTWRFYLLNDSTTSITADFSILDYTGGDFSTSDTKIILRRALAGQSRHIAGGYRGVGNSMGAILQLGGLYDVWVANDDETRVLGAYYATSSGDVQLTVGLVTYPRDITPEYGWLGYNVTMDYTLYENGTYSDAWIAIIFNDSSNQTTWVNITITDADNLSHVYYQDNVTANTSLIYLIYRPPLADIEDGTVFLVNITSRINPTLNELIRIDLRGQGGPIVVMPYLEENQEYAWIFGATILVFCSLMFTYRYTDVGGFVVGFVGVAEWAIGLLPRSALSISVIILIFIIASLNAVLVKRHKGEL